MAATGIFRCSCGFVHFHIKTIAVSNICFPLDHSRKSFASVPLLLVLETQRFNRRRRAFYSASAHRVTRRNTHTNRIRKLLTARNAIVTTACFTWKLIVSQFVGTNGVKLSHTVHKTFSQNENVDVLPEFGPKNHFRSTISFGYSLVNGIPKP